jgi:uncharacterized membrane-anchored protein YhcB (DUF1043 family)
MDSRLKSKEKELELKKVENEIETQRAEISQKKALEAEMKQRYGSDWKKILGMVGKGLSMKTNAEKAHDLYSVNSDLKNLAIPRRLGT